MFALLCCVFLPVGWEGGEGSTHSVLGQQELCCPVCLCLQGGFQVGAWQAEQLTDPGTDLCVQEAHPRKPGVRNRELREIDAHF